MCSRKMQKHFNVKNYVTREGVHGGMQIWKCQKNTEVTQQDYSINRSKQAAVLNAPDIFFYRLSKED